MSREVRISELFGPTVQGEGPTAGRRCAFVRFGLCNLQCAWCDTPYTWDWSGINGTAYDKSEQLTVTTVADIIDRLDSLDVDRVVITGGEPLIQKGAHADLVTGLRALDYVIETETNGTLRPHEQLHSPDKAIRWNLSPKLPSAGQHNIDPINVDTLRWWTMQPYATFKFVIDDDDDLAAIEAVCQAIDLELDDGRVWLMPQGRTAAEVAVGFPSVADAAVALGCNVTSRLHVEAWGDVRGK